MKRNILHTLWAAALLLTGCTQEELPLPGADNAAPLAITITDGGYALTTSADGSQKAATRATEDGYRTEFTASDACGLYLVRNGAIVYDNVKLTATAGTNGSLTWQPVAGVTLAGGLAGEKSERLHARLHSLRPHDRHGLGKQSRRQALALILHDPPHGTRRSRNAQDGV